MPAVRRTPAPRRAAARAVVGIVVGMLAATAACSSPGTAGHAVSAPSTRPTLPSLPPPAPIAWLPCPTQPALQCGSVDVPLDYRHPGAGSLAIAVARAPATDGRATDGDLLMNPGGPGESGLQILPVELPLLPAAVRAHSDVVSFDPRGTGASGALQCGTDPSTVTAAEPVPTAAGLPLPGTPVFAGIARACATLHPALTAAVDTTDTARDMDRIRQALGRATISFYGLSYGTVLGTVYAALFPHRVRAMVLDGAVDMDASLATQAAEQAPAAERSLHHLLATCAAAAACPLGADPTSFFIRLSASMTSHPLPAPGNGDDVPVTVGDLDTATLLALSVTQFTPAYEAALVAAVHGDGSQLRSLAREFVVDIDGTPLVDAQWAIVCNDTVGHTRPRPAGTLARTLAARYPLLGGYAVTYNLGGCVTWPDGRQPVSDTHPTAAPPVLVLGNTGDPNTPLVGGRHLAALFPHAAQLTWVGWGHTWLLSGASDTCVSSAVTRYLSGGGLPPAGTVCR
jgi:pimeloyl-ACP methyl ester carboxylesterase